MAKDSNISDLGRFSFQQFKYMGATHHRDKKLCSPYTVTDAITLFSAQRKSFIGS